jgi:hypothetical protein
MSRFDLMPPFAAGIKSTLLSISYTRRHRELLEFQLIKPQATLFALLRSTCSRQKAKRVARKKSISPAYMGKHTTHAYTCSEACSGGFPSVKIKVILAGRQRQLGQSFAPLPSK